MLKLKGRFQTAPKQVKYQLGFIQSEGAWKLSGVTIDIEVRRFRGGNPNFIPRCRPDNVIRMPHDRMR